MTENPSGCTANGFPIVLLLFVAALMAVWTMLRSSDGPLPDAESFSDELPPTSLPPPPPPP